MNQNIIKTTKGLAKGALIVGGTLAGSYLLLIGGNAIEKQNDIELKEHTGNIEVTKVDGAFSYTQVTFNDDQNLYVVTHNDVAFPFNKTQKTLYEGGTFGDSDGKVDVIDDQNSQGKNPLFRLTDYASHKSEFDKADKDFTNTQKRFEGIVEKVLTQYNNIKPLCKDCDAPGALTGHDLSGKFTD